MTQSDTPDMADRAGACAPVDLGVLARLMGRSDPAALNRMLAVFWQTEADTPRVLSSLVLARDGKALAAAAHGAKGAASSVGAMKIADLCKALELSAKENDWDAAGRLVTQVDQAYAEVGAFIANAPH
jgi:HPt (histidine-containing phosphotransfer) domain-containing protein